MRKVTPLPRFAKVRHMLFYVADTTIPKDSPKNPRNQRVREFGGRLAMLWFCLTDKEAWASLKAGRIEFVNVM